MRVLIVAEGKHELGQECEDGALVILVRRLVSRRIQVECEKVSSAKVRVHRRPGREGGFWKRDLAWTRYAQNQRYDALVLVIDQDGRREREQELNKAQEDERFAFPRALGVAVRTFDAWLLADERALSQSLGVLVSRQSNPESLRDPKAVCRRMLDAHENPISQSRLYADAARALSLDVLQSRCSQGFAPFADRVRRL